MDRMPDAPSVTLIVPVKDEDPAIIEALVRETQTRFQGKVSIQVVDDGSKVPCPVSTLRHPTSLGYGAALKAGIRAATTEWVCTLDGDGQHRLRDVERLIEFVDDFPEVDMVIGNRRLREESLKRYWGRAFLNATAALFAHRWIPDLNSGLRIFRRKMAIGYEPILCDTFSFTTSLALSAIADGYHVDWLPIKVAPRPHGKSHVKVWRDGWVTLKYICYIGMALRTRRIRGWLRHLRDSP